jgi:AraC-like DNA-binding protein
MTEFKIAAEPENWRLISSVIAPEDSPVYDKSYDEWLETAAQKHRHREILFCLTGETREAFNGRIYRCLPGTVFLFDADEGHACGYPGETGSFLHLWIMLLNGSSVCRFYCREDGSLPESKNMSFTLPDSERRVLEDVWDRLKAAPERVSPEMRRAALASAVLVILFRAMENWARPKSAPENSRRRADIIAAIQKHIGENLGCGENLDTLAHISGYSKFHFSRLFKESSGQTVHDFINSCRVKKAAEMLRRGALGKEIAAELGFSCPAAFSNWARKNKIRP